LTLVQPLRQPITSDPVINHGAKRETNEPVERKKIKTDCVV